MFPEGPVALPEIVSRLEHALTLYREHLAPLVVTLGGAGGDNDSEGGVGHDYLVAHGVPESQIIAETQSTNTEESAARLAGIARENVQPKSPSRSATKPSTGTLIEEISMDADRRAGATDDDP